MAIKAAKKLKAFKFRLSAKRYRKLLPFTPAIVVILGFAVTGIILTIASRAATYTAPKEAEAGTIAGMASTKADTKASGSSFVSFGGAGTTPPTPPPVTPPTGGAGDEANSAAVKLNWGTPTTNETFDSLSNWGLYTAAKDFGNKKPQNISVSGGIMTIAGKSDGTTGGMAYNKGQKYGRWENRVKISGDEGCWRPVQLLWPDAEDWPVGGEVDYAESGGDWGEVNFFLHYGANNSQTSDSASLDATQWTYYAMEWTSTGIKGYINGKEFFSDTNTSHLPPRAMHQTFQLDAQDHEGSCSGNVQFAVDSMKIYPVN